jgi:hypothetical protein
MRPESSVRLTPRMEAAVHELQGLITVRLQQATFVVEEGFDPKGSTRRRRWISPTPTRSPPSSGTGS